MKNKGCLFLPLATEFIFYMWARSATGSDTLWLVVNAAVAALAVMAFIYGLVQAARRTLPDNFPGAKGLGKK